MLTVQKTRQQYTCRVSHIFKNVSLTLSFFLSVDNNMVIHFLTVNVSAV